MPCLNESQTLGECISRATGFLDSFPGSGEILVADNNSSDGSPEIAESMGARVVHVKQPGYGRAVMGGIHAANSRYIIMGDSDLSYDFSKLTPFVSNLRNGYQLVLGNRFQGGIVDGAMPALHRYLGNPFFSLLARLLFRTGVGDINCGLRGFDRDSIIGLNLQSNDMTFVSEMTIKAAKKGLRITEVPIKLYPDQRGRAPHLKTWRDGWKILNLYFRILTGRP